jgi:hypothetical protein
MRRRVLLVVLPRLLAAALIAEGCTESLRPPSPSSGGERVGRLPAFAASVALTDIGLTRANGTLSQSGTMLIKGFNPTNPHHGDAIVATFVWIGSTNIITSVTDVLTSPCLPVVGNTYTLTDYVTSGGLSMATYVATDVQNFPDPNDPASGVVLAVRATLSQPVVAGGVVVSSYGGRPVALGAHRSATGTDSSPTTAGTGTIPVSAGALVYGVTVSNALAGLSTPAAFANVHNASDAAMKVDAQFFVPTSAGTVTPEWTWHFNSPESVRTWLASVVALEPIPRVASVTVSPASSSVYMNSTQQLSATLRDSSGNIVTGRTVAWTSSAPQVATVSASGLVTAVSPGSATITGEREGETGPAVINVMLPPVLFDGDWSGATGNSIGAVTDGGRWTRYTEYNNGIPVQLLSVVPEGPGGRNALKVLQRGSSFAANLVKQNVLPPSTDYYVRFYMRNDDTSFSGDHVVTPDMFDYGNLTYIRKTAAPTGWQAISSFYGAGYTYPIGHWTLNRTLSHGVWYRFEYYVHFVSATQMRVEIRVYDDSGAQIASEADYQQSSFGSQVWNGRSDWTLASYYQAGYTLGVNPLSLTTFSLGNNGQFGALDTGLAWYFAGVQIRSDHWPGP